MINPILASSARRRMRSMRTALIITVYGLVIFAIGLAVAFGGMLGDTVNIYTMQKGLEAYVVMMIVQFALLVLVTPAMTAGSIAGERERQTLDLLLVTNTGSVRIVMGKLMEALGFIALLVVSTLPAMGLVVLTGSISIWQLLTGLLFLVVTAFAALSVGIFTSALMRRTVAATVTAYLLVLFIGIVTLVQIVFDVKTVDTLLYDTTFTAASGTQGSLTLWSCVFNPALGLLCMLFDQSGMLRSVLEEFSYMFPNAEVYIDFTACYWKCMGFMAACGLALDMLAACFVRSRGVRRKRGGGRA